MSNYEELMRRLRDLDTCDERGSFMPDPLGLEAAEAIKALLFDLAKAKSKCDATLTHLWGQPVSEMRHALEFLEQHAGTTDIRASVKRLTLILKGQRDLIAQQQAELISLRSK